MSSSSAQKKRASPTTTPDKEAVQPSSPLPRPQSPNSFLAALQNVDNPNPDCVPADVPLDTQFPYGRPQKVQAEYHDLRPHEPLDDPSIDLFPKAPAKPYLSELKISAVSKLDFSPRNKSDTRGNNPHLLESSSELNTPDSSPTIDTALPTKQKSSAAAPSLKKKPTLIEKNIIPREFDPSASAQENYSKATSSKILPERQPSPIASSSSLSPTSTSDVPPFIPQLLEIQNLRTNVQSLLSDLLIIQGAFQDLDPTHLTTAATYGPKRDTKAAEYLTKLDQELLSLQRKAVKRLEGRDRWEPVSLERQVSKFDNLRKGYENTCEVLDGVRENLEEENGGEGEEGVFVYKLRTRYKVLRNQGGAEADEEKRPKRGTGVRGVKKAQNIKVKEKMKVSVEKARVTKPRPWGRGDENDETLLGNSEDASVDISKDSPPNKRTKRFGITMLSVNTEEITTVDSSTKMKTKVVPTPGFIDGSKAQKRKERPATTSNSDTFGSDVTSENDDAYASKRTCTGRAVVHPSTNTKRQHPSAPHYNYGYLPRRILMSGSTDANSDDEDVLAKRPSIDVKSARKDKGKEEIPSFPNLEMGAGSSVRRATVPISLYRGLSDSPGTDKTGQIRREKSSKGSKYVRVKQQNNMSQPASVESVEGARLPQVHNHVKDGIAIKETEDDMTHQRL